MRYYYCSKARTIIINKNNKKQTQQISKTDLWYQKNYCNNDKSITAPNQQEKLQRIFGRWLHQAVQIQEEILGSKILNLKQTDHTIYDK